MEQIFTVATLWLALAVLPTPIAFHLRVSVALIEICVGVGVAPAFSVFGLQDVLTPNADWVRFLAAVGAVVLTFLAGAELDPLILRSKLKEVSVVGLVGFAAPFLGCVALAYYVLGWDSRASWLCGVRCRTLKAQTRIQIPFRAPRTLIKSAPTLAFQPLLATFTGSSVELLPIAATVL